MESQLPAGLSATDNKMVEFFKDNGTLYALYHGQKIHFSELPDHILYHFKKEMDNWPKRCKAHGITDEMDFLQALEVYLSHEYGLFDKVPDLDANGISHRELAAEDAILEYDLSPREVEVLQLICHNHNVPQIAKHLSLASSTVQNHCANIKEKLGLSSRLDLVFWALKNNLYSIAS